MSNIILEKVNNTPKHRMKGVTITYCTVGQEKMLKQML